MANSKHLAKLKEGVEAWNDWRKANPKVDPDLSEADLSRPYLSRGLPALFEHRIRLLHKRSPVLAGPHLQLGEADFDKANLAMAEEDIMGSGLRGLDLSRVRLYGTNFTGADLGEADITGAILGFTTFGDNDLSRVKGLNTVQHHSPSTIGIDTIYRSKGSIPLAFLRGAGVPESFIEYMGSLTGKALEFYSCFISYSAKDQEFADRLYADLQDKGVRCWFAPHDIQLERRSMSRLT